MQIVFAPPRSPASGSWVILVAGDGSLGPTGAELDRRAGGALTRALKDWGELKRGEAIDGRVQCLPFVPAERPERLDGDARLT